MRKLALFLCLCLVLTGCTPPAPVPTAAPEVSLTADQVARAVLESQADTEGLTALPEGERSDRVTLSWNLEEPWEDVAIYAGTGMDGREIAVVLLAEGGDTDAAAAALEAYRLSREGDFFGYAPEQSELLKRAAVRVQGRYVALLACADVAEAEAAMGRALSGEEPPHETRLPEVTAVPTLGPAESDGPTPMPQQSVGPTPEPEATAALAIADFPPYTQPNETDMTLYDLEPLLEAWRNEDPAGLSEKDKAVYEICKAAFDKVITPEMSDFQKELALHDWLLKQGEYDYSAYETPDHVGRPDNRNPYGMLVDGFGICLGYARTFELLMKMAEVECITVVGAAFRSTGDHAWNLVKLDGDWYAVDATWNDSSTGSFSQAKAQAYAHRYFNVTSQEMRDSNHQWDYANVPEATATHYRWDGTGPLPEET